LALFLKTAIGDDIDTRTGGILTEKDPLVFRQAALGRGHKYILTFISQKQAGGLAVHGFHGTVHNYFQQLILFGGGAEGLANFTKCFEIVYLTGHGAPPIRMRGKDWLRLVSYSLSITLFSYLGAGKK
jgi:hypothetical protein